MSETARPTYLGVGIGYRGRLSAATLASSGEFDCFEVMCDSFFSSPRSLLALRALRPLVPHSLSLSVGSEVDPDYLQKVKGVVELTRNPFYSDHLCFTQVDGHGVGHLTPLPWNEEALETVVRNVKEVMRVAGPGFALENITNPFLWPNSTMTESEFINEIVRRTGCGLLVDVENVRINAANHGVDPYKFLESLPLERVVQVHVAGGLEDGGIELDTHNAPVREETWDLLRHLAGMVRPRATILERDDDFPDMAQLVGEVRMARSIVGGPGF